MSINFGVGYNREYNYGQNLIMEGTNTNSSLLDYFANMANGTPYTDLYPYEEGIAWDVYMIDTLDGQPLNYATVLSLWGSEPNSTYGQLQRRTVFSKNMHRIRSSMKPVPASIFEEINTGRSNTRARLVAPSYSRYVRTTASRPRVDSRTGA